PVRAQRLDDVQMSEQEQGLLAAVAPEARDQVALPGKRLEDLHVRLGKPRLPEMPSHALRSERGVAGRMRGIRFDQLLVDGVKALLLRAERLGCRGEGNRADRQRADASLPVHPGLLCPSLTPTEGCIYRTLSAGQPTRGDYYGQAYARSSGLVRICRG